MISETQLLNHLQDLIDSDTEKAKSIEEHELRNYIMGRRNALQKLKTDILMGAFEESEEKE